MSERIGIDAGEGAIENEHRIQSGLVKALLTVIGQGGEPGEVLGALTDYSRAHFLSEELLMRLHAYPDYEGHCQDHERLMEELEALACAGKADLRSAAEGVASAIRRHISTRDKRLGEYIESLSND